MSLPQALRSSMTPTDLELVASEELIEIRPTVKMDKIRFISVGSSLTRVQHNYLLTLHVMLGDLRPVCRRKTSKGSSMDGGQLEAEKEMQCCLS